MPRRSNLRHFQKGILLISQWTGTEYKNMEKVFLGILAGPAEAGLIRVVRTLLDFIYYAHFESHTSDSLRKLNTAWVAFHENLQYFVDKGVRKDRDNFNIPKLHSMHHYIDSIISRGSADSFSTESPECLHIGQKCLLGYQQKELCQANDKVAGGSRCLLLILRISAMDHQRV
jgi:hypothetical protein